MSLRRSFFVLFLFLSIFCFASETESFFCYDSYNKIYACSNTITTQKDTIIKKKLPDEFPENYHQEVEDYYNRQKFPKKALRKLENIRNYSSFSTNMLFDAVLIPNIAIEFTILPKWSLVTNWMYSWWNKKRPDIYWRIYGGDITLRHWFGKKSRTRKLTGHHIGVYAQALTYDFTFGGQGQITDKWNYGFGIEYGHSFVIARNFNIDVFVGITSLYGGYSNYKNEGGHPQYQLSVVREGLAFFPTKIGASLVWILPLKRKSILYEQ